MLEAVLNRAAQFMERREALKRRVKSAMIYPVAVLIIASGIVMFLLIKVVPVFADIFKEFGGELPWPTQFLMSAGDFMIYNWWMVISIVAWTVIFMKILFKFHAVRRFRDRIELKIPLIGDLVTKVAVSRFARTLEL
jgi:type IV pilus assembly protein PilC